MTSVNIASHIPAMAALDPKRAALIAPDGRGGWSSMSFGELNARSDAYARGLEAIGIGRGVRTVLMVPPSFDFFPLVFGLFKAGAVIVLIDPGIGRAALLKCLDEVEPEAFIGIPPAHVARLLFPKPFRKVKATVTVGRRWFWGGHTAKQVLALGGTEPYRMADPAPNETAAILFTSGSTGIPKGVVYTHEIFDAQVRLIRDTYGIQPGEIDLPTFPLFALFDPALGMTAVLPEMDFRSPAKADPVKLIDAITRHGCTSMFGSPALVDNLSRHAKSHRVTLPTLKRALCAGAPVRNDVLERMSACLTGEAQVFTPFGATESLPVASIGSREAVTETASHTAAGAGVCVGRPVTGVTVRIIRITDSPIPSWSDELLVPDGTIGEITVRGPIVTPEYFRRPEQTALAKIREGDAIVHRMGDVGYLDPQGRLWMCGRKSHRVETASGTLFTVPIEETLNQNPWVKRTALVGVGPKGQQRPVVLVELNQDLINSLSHRPPPEVSWSAAQHAQSIKTFAASKPHTAGLESFHVYPGAFPVDARHNAKIEREKLAKWAQEQGL
ncbi:MAG: AMP-binding protein [Archangium sp.]|nr:AMP-binding protein [Archangium sp.]